jgi:hypothetical protein
MTCDRSIPIDAQHDFGVEHADESLEVPVPPGREERADHLLLHDRAKMRPMRFEIRRQYFPVAHRYTLRRSRVIDLTTWRLGM